MDVRDIATGATKQCSIFMASKVKQSLLLKQHNVLQSKPLQDRLDIVLAGIKAVENMGNEKLVQDLAKMMGRPVRYGCEYAGFKQRGE